MIFSELIMNKLKRVQIKSKTFIEKTYLFINFFILQESMDNPWQVAFKIVQHLEEKHYSARINL